MKLENLSHFVVVFLVLAALSHAQPASPAKHEASIRPFLGRWDLTLTSPRGGRSPRRWLARYRSSEPAHDVAAF